MTPAFIAQTAAEYAPMLQFGAMGTMLAWFMGMSIFMLRLWKDTNHRLDSLAGAIWTDILERESASDKIKARAAQAVARIEARDRRD